MAPEVFFPRPNAQIMSGQPIRVSELDPNFKRDVMAHEAARDITACFARGMPYPYIWYCSECDICEQNCPQRVKFSGVRDILKDMAAK